MTIPNWYQMLLLAGAAFRIWRLLAEDDLLDWPRRKLLRLGEWREEGDLIPANYHRSLGKFLTCSWCFGAWVALIWWMAWEVWPHGTIIAAVPWVLSAVVGAIAKLLAD